MLHLRTASKLTVRSVHEKRIDVTARREDAYSIHIAKGLAAGLGEQLPSLARRCGSPDITIILDAGAAHYLPTVESAAWRADVPVNTITVQPGESSKSVEGLESLWERFRDTGISRRTLLIGLGGGVVCDLTTFAASSYMRGIPYALIPTTVLAQIDAAIGGKGGVDYGGAKNLLGAFHHPAAVFIDPDLTLTLPDRHRRNGIAEAIKVGIIGDAPLFEMLALGAGDVTGDPQLFTAIVRSAVTAKLDLLATDPFEQRDLRRLLNLGHCIGHPLEAATGYEMLHGEAVAAGTACAAAVSHRLGLCSEEDRDRIVQVLADYQLPTGIKPELRGPVWEGIETVRKIRNGPLHLVLPRRPGACTVVDDIGRELYDAALNDLDTRSWATR